MGAKVRALVLISAVLVGACGLAEEQTSETTTTSTTLTKPGFDPARPETALAPLPGYQYRNLTAAEEQAARREVESDPDVKALLKGYAIRGLRKGGRELGSVQAMGFDPQLSTSPSFQQGMVEGFKADTVRAETLTLAGQPATMTEEKDGSVFILWTKAGLALILNVDQKRDRPDLEQVATALITANK